MKSELVASISKMIPNGKRLELPKTEQFENYPAVKKALIDAGGKYKRCGFDFSEDAADIQARLVGGEVINDKKKFQFFPTPPELAELIVEYADIEPHHDVLEPSAGQGAIANLIPGCEVVELMAENVKALKRQGYSPFEGDFLLLDFKDQFDRIVANPPFTKNQDIDHIRHMYFCLKPGGKLVSVASRSWTFGSQKKQIAFREWLDGLDSEVTNIEPGAFKSSGTMVGSVIVEIYKPK